MEILTELRERKNAIYSQMGKLRLEMRAMTDADAIKAKHAEYKELRKEIIQLTKEMQDIELRDKIDKQNHFHAEINRIWPLINDYKGKVTKVDGTQTKSFKTHIKGIDIDPEIVVYAVRRYGSDTVILRGKGILTAERTFGKDHEDLKMADYDEVIEARELHNVLVAQVEALMESISANYPKATGYYADENPYGMFKPFN